MNDKTLKKTQTSLLNLTMNFLHKNSYLIGLKAKVKKHRNNNFIQTNHHRPNKSLSVQKILKKQQEEDIHDIYDSPLPKIYTSLSVQQSNSKVFSLQKQQEAVQQTKFIDHKYLFIGFNKDESLGQSCVPSARYSDKYKTDNYKTDKSIILNQQLRKRRHHTQENRNKAKSLIKMEMIKHQDCSQLKRNLTTGNYGNQTFLKMVPIKTQNDVTVSSNPLSSILKNVFAKKNKQKLNPNFNIRQSQNMYIKLQKQLCTQYKEEMLLKRLTGIANDTNKDTIRIYKQDFSKIYAARYGRDKITSFFDFQYIEDFQSLKKMMNTIIHLNSDQILVLTFLILDFNSDGIISHSDIFSILTLIGQNQLIKKDLYRIIKYVMAENEKAIWVQDQCDSEFLKKDNLTLSKYRFMVYMEQKNPTPKSQNKNNKISLNLRKHLFSLKKQQQQQNKNKNLLKQFLQSFIKRGHQTNSQQKTFKINFNRFKCIFNSSPPCIFLDVLYALSGLQLKQHTYQKLNSNFLVKQKKIIKFQQISRYQKTMKIYHNLKKNYNIPYLKIQNLRAKVKSVL